MHDLPENVTQRQLSLWVGAQKVNGWFWAFGICIGLWAYWGGAGA